MAVRDGDARADLGPSTASTHAGALITGMCLWGGLLLGLGGGILLSDVPGHMVLQLVFGVLPVVVGTGVGGAVWGSRMGRLVGSRETRRMNVAGVLGFLPITILAVVGLSLLESFTVHVGGSPLPVHRIFTLLFVPTSFLVAASATLALAIGLRRGPDALAWAWRAGLAAAAAFLLVDLLMEVAGWRVGGPGAAERFTMLTVAFAGALGSALAAGAAVGHALRAATRGRRDD